MCWKSKNSNLYWNSSGLNSVGKSSEFENLLGTTANLADRNFANSLDNSRVFGRFVGSFQNLVDFASKNRKAVSKDLLILEGRVHLDNFDSSLM